jgi:hypothetical protein
MNNQLHRNILIDYQTHRKAIGYLGLILIIRVVLLDHLIPLTSSGTDILRGSISAYYHSAGGFLFVGILFIIGLALMAYKGFKGDFKYTFSAGICALGIAIFPTYPANKIVAVNFGIPSTSDFWPMLFNNPLSQTIHAIFAITFFVLLWIIMNFRFTLSNRPKNNRKYRILSGIMLASSVAAVILFFVEINSEDAKQILENYKVVFWVEVIGIFCFSLAWLTKGRAIIPIIGQLYKDEDPAP